MYRLVVLLLLAQSPSPSVWVITERGELKGPAPRYEWRIETTYRQPSGHTHSDGFHTWDHVANPKHVCNALVIRNGKVEACGRVQTIVDSPSRMVTVTRKVAVRVE